MDYKTKARTNKGSGKGSERQAIVCLKKIIFWLF